MLEQYKRAKLKQQKKLALAALLSQQNEKNTSTLNNLTTTEHDSSGLNPSYGHLKTQESALKENNYYILNNQITSNSQSLTRPSLKSKDLSINLSGLRIKTEGPNLRYSKQLINDDSLLQTEVKQQNDQLNKSVEFSAETMQNLSNLQSDSALRTPLRGNNKKKQKKQTEKQDSPEKTAVENSPPPPLESYIKILEDQIIDPSFIKLEQAYLMQRQSKQRSESPTRSPRPNNEDTKKSSQKVERSQSQVMKTLERQLNFLRKLSEDKMSSTFTKVGSQDGSPTQKGNQNDFSLLPVIKETGNSQDVRERFLSGNFKKVNPSFVMNRATRSQSGVYVRNPPQASQLKLEKLNSSNLDSSMSKNFTSSDARKTTTTSFKTPDLGLQTAESQLGRARMRSANQIPTPNLPQVVRTRNLEENLGYQKSKLSSLNKRKLDPALDPDEQKTQQYLEEQRLMPEMQGHNYINLIKQSPVLANRTQSTISQNIELNSPDCSPSIINHYFDERYGKFVLNQAQPNKLGQFSNQDFGQRELASKLIPRDPNQVPKIVQELSDHIQYAFASNKTVSKEDVLSLFYTGLYHQIEKDIDKIDQLLKIQNNYELMQQRQALETLKERLNIIETHLGECLDIGDLLYHNQKKVSMYQNNLEITIQNIDYFYQIVEHYNYPEQKITDLIMLIQQEEQNQLEDVEMKEIQNFHKSAVDITNPLNSFANLRQQRMKAIKQIILDKKLRKMTNF